MSTCQRIDFNSPYTTPMIFFFRYSEKIAIDFHYKRKEITSHEPKLPMFDFFIT
jgi:hypothetical protein